MRKLLEFLQGNQRETPGGHLPCLVTRHPRNPNEEGGLPGKRPACAWRGVTAQDTRDGLSVPESSRDDNPMMQPDFLETAQRAAGAAVEVLRSSGVPRTVQHKSRRDLVTDVDVEAQREVFRIITSAFPEHSVLGEESPPPTGIRPEFLWVVDPLDGTTNFAHGVPFYCVSVALLRHGVPQVGVVWDPVRDECFAARAGSGGTCNGAALRVRATEHPEDGLMACSFAAEVAKESLEGRRFLTMLPHARAVRRMGSSALNLAYVAAGRFD
ncbi:MAG TPA: inositol monophosphatase family protein, partial [Pirellulaceae bacterium]